MASHINISQTEDGVRLQRWFLRNFANVPLRDFYRLCRGGQIRVNSKRCAGQEILRGGDVVRIPPTISRQPSVVRKSEDGARFSLSDLESLRRCIIHDDDDIVVFDKPAGLAVQGGTGIKRSIDKMAAALFPFAKISLVHRLDRDTSGILVVAKNQNAAQNLAAQFQDKTARKEYLALLNGRVSPAAGVIDNWMARGAVFDSADKFSDDVKPQRAITGYDVMTDVHGLLTWILFRPKTGRTHQLRMHSAFSLDAPIVGDTVYGFDKKKKVAAGELAAMLNTKNLFLFAWRLTFRHPRTNREMTVAGQLPDFMRAVAKFLELKMPE